MHTGTLHNLDTQRQRQRLCTHNIDCYTQPCNSKAAHRRGRSGAEPRRSQDMHHTCQTNGHARHASVCSHTPRVILKCNMMTNPLHPDPAPPLQDPATLKPCPFRKGLAQRDLHQRQWPTDPWTLYNTWSTAPQVFNTMPSSDSGAIQTTLQVRALCGDRQQGTGNTAVPTVQQYS
jgi:hypothetical protein